MDQDVTLFQKQSLDALRHNYPVLQQLSGSISFAAEAESPVLTATAWHLTEADNVTLKKLGAKAAILELLDSLVEQRKRQRIRPNREGCLLIDDGKLEIEWLTQSDMSLSIY